MTQPFIAEGKDEPHDLRVDNFAYSPGKACTRNNFPMYNYSALYVVHKSYFITSPPASGLAALV